MRTFLRPVRLRLVAGPAGLLLLLGGTASAQPRLVMPSSADLGTVRPGQTVRHAVRVRNAGTEALRLLEVQLSRGLSLSPAPATVPAGAEVSLDLAVDTRGAAGLFEGTVVIRTNDPARDERTLHLRANVVPAVEVVPRAALFAVAQRGVRKEVAVELVNRDAVPFEVVQVEHSTDRFTSRLETLDVGRRYRLVLELRPNGPGGRHTDTITVHTTNPWQRTVRIAAYTHLREAVYTFPAEVDLGSLRIDELRQHPDLLGQYAQTLMVYQPGGSKFQVQFETDLPFLAIHAERGPDGDRWQATVALDSSRMTTGPVRGVIRVVTNDPRVPLLEVPVLGELR